MPSREVAPEARRLTYTTWLAAALVLLLVAIGRAQELNNPQRLSVAGTPEEIGTRVGQRYAPLIKGLHQLAVSVGAGDTRLPKAALYQRAALIGERLAAEDREELKALAAASGLTYEDALYMNVFYSLTTKRFACRQLAAWGEKTSGGALMHARNLDWHDYPGQPLQKHHLILNVKPTDGLEHVLLTWPGLMTALTGTNRAGITVAFNALPDGDGDRVAEPTFFTLKRVLRTCETLDEAIALVREARPLDNGSVMISDATNKTAAVLDLWDGQVGVRRADGPLVGNANSITTREGLTGNGWKRWIGTADTHACVIAAGLGELDAAKIRRVMTDPKVLASYNLLSVVFVPAENRMLLAAGAMPAGEGEFREYRLFE